MASCLELGLILEAGFITNSFQYIALAILLLPRH